MPEDGWSGQLTRQPGPGSACPWWPPRLQELTRHQGWLQRIGPLFDFTYDVCVFLKERFTGFRGAKCPQWLFWGFHGCQLSMQFSATLLRDQYLIVLDWTCRHRLQIDLVIEWWSPRCLNQYTSFVFLPLLFFFREWYMNGNYLVIIVSIAIILPLALMKQLGKYVDSRPTHHWILMLFYNLIKYLCLFSNLHWRRQLFTKTCYCSKMNHKQQNWMNHLIYHPK